MPEPEDPYAVTATSDGVVMFLLGARINQFVFRIHYEGAIGLDVFFSNMPFISPLGKHAPDNAEIDKAFKDMWIEAEKNRTKWTCESQYQSFQFACTPESVLKSLVFIQISGEAPHYSIFRTVKGLPLSGYPIGRISRAFRDSQLHPPID